MPAVIIFMTQKVIKYWTLWPGLWCVNVGYGREELVEAAANQMRQLPYYNAFFKTSHPAVAELSKRLASLAPDGLNHVFYANSGSEAV